MLKSLANLVGGKKDTTQEQILKSLNIVLKSVFTLNSWQSMHFKQLLAINYDRLAPMSDTMQLMSKTLTPDTFAEKLADKLSNIKPENAAAKGKPASSSAELSAEEKKEKAVAQEEQVELLKEQNNFIHGIQKSVEAINKNLDKLVKHALSKAGAGLFSGGKAAGGGAGGAIKGLLTGVGEGLTALGKGISGLGTGIGKAIEGILSGLARGLMALSNPKLLIGVGVMLGLAGALWVAAQGFQAFGDVTWDAVIKGTVAMGILTVAAMVLGKVMTSGVGAVAILLGAVAIAALGASLIPAAYAAKLAAPLFEAMAVVIEKLGDAIVKIISAGFDGIIKLFGELAKVDVLKIAMIGPALIAMGAGLAALTGGSLLSSFGDFVGSLFGAKSPIEKLQDLAATAPGISLLASALGLVAQNLTQFTASMKDLDTDKILGLATNLTILFEVISKMNSGDVMTTLQGMFGISSPIENIKELAKTSEPMRILAESVGVLNDKLSGLLKSLSEVDPENINKLGPALKGIGEGLDSMVKVTIQTDVAETFLGIDSPFTKIEKLASQAPNMQQLADAISQIDLSGLSLDDRDIENLDILITKLHELNFAMAGMQFAKLTTAASSLAGDMMNVIGQDINKLFGIEVQSTQEQKTQSASSSGNVVPVKIVEISSDGDMPTKITSLLREKTIEEKIGTAGGGTSIISAPTVNNVSSSGGTTINASSVNESPTNAEPLMLSAIKGDLSAM